MIRLAIPLVLAALAAVPARALAPDAQTLEALRGEGVADPGRLFDGSLGVPVETLAPIGYAPLPSRAKLLPRDGAPAAEILPGLPAPVPSQPRSARAGGVSRAAARGTL
ncbi:MAG: hypothetical protein KGM24_10850, partial [Elusimicrobia bacterium]|nr:hypothetical protein [Elusimicrobiota bacterium]